MSEDGPASESFAELLRFFRVRSGLSQGDLAMLARLSARTISDLERGVRRRAYLPTVQALAIALGLTPEERQRFAATVQRARVRRLQVPVVGHKDRAELPTYASQFIGRDHELTMLTELLRAGDHRLVTVTGAPGAGKSRLVIEVAHALRRDDDMPVRYVPLESTSRAQSLAMLIAADSALASSTAALLVIDNLERLPGLDSLRQALCVHPALRILATSRVATMLPGEHEFNLAPLSLPPEQAPGEVMLPEAIASSPAVRMFLDCRASQAGVRLPPEAAGAVHSLSRELDGLPRAIEVAAEWIRRLNLVALATNHDAARALAEAVREAHRTVQASAEESYHLLPPSDQWAFRRLGVYTGEWTVDDAVDLLMSAPEPGQPALNGREAYNRLNRLVEHSLVQVEVSESTVRFRMLESIRKYAFVLLEREGELGEAQVLVNRCALRLSKETVTRIAGEDAGLWRVLMAQRSATLEAMLEDCARRNDGETAATMLWDMRQLLAEGVYRPAARWVARALASPGCTSVGTGKLLILAACVRAGEGHATGAWRQARRGLNLLRVRPRDRVEALHLLPPDLAMLLQENPNASRQSPV